MNSFSRFGRLAARPPFASRGQRIGLLGGSFNPPHAAHVLISETALTRLQLDSVWWLVTPGNPLKSASVLKPLEDRVAAARRLARDRRIVVTDFERHLPTPYTAATLDYLRRRYPEVHFTWLMGADCLAEFHRWRQWQRIFELLPVAVIDRPGWRFRGVASRAAVRFAAARVAEAVAPMVPVSAPPCWVFLTGPMSPLSSTILRGGGPNGARQSPMG